MFTQQDLFTAIISFAAGIVGALIAVLTAYLQQRMARDDEKRKVIREKIEDIYTLLNQVQAWAALQVTTLEGLLAIRSGKSTGTGHTPGDGDCPIDKIVTFIHIYFPKLRKKINTYNLTVQDVDTLCEAVNEKSVKGVSLAQAEVEKAKEITQQMQKQTEQLQSELATMVQF